jgi:hypothetical protein
VLLSLNFRARLALGILALLCFTSVADAKTSEKQRILRACAREFGSVVDPKQNLFEINPAFVLQANFDRHGSLSEFAVKPKYSFNETHPEWEEPRDFPVLSWTEFKDLVTRLDALKPKRRLIRPAIPGTSIITNSTGYFTEVYERATVKYGEFLYRGHPRNGIRFFTVGYPAKPGA